ncbi:type I secretion system permease/ATPase [Aliarcobacter cibarius]|uniref:Type I secretion system ATPase/permease, LssB family n=1 Tax=Aliarcobacter cibarius TaxID=255507 RepID=A0A7L5JQE2_9BACT|nr:type I secretion system permease/ATPase [Aliarcobacter cibarius]QKJ27296.1 type I secretion system ATPase/permease, LssB family [Aliarcobacter cibarius]TLT01488.1 type I secretion system permease/ATPase [Aliarcobacter cibarius]TLT01979.1 type I secretion system permease/ATPase [Aliarcobacter cibarius]TLT04179.1 type I secretion system permease/ATPase [Aliarcobacter cibarius]
MYDQYNEETLNSLLESLVTFTKFYHKPFSRESLVHDLPIENGKFAPELFSLGNSKGLFSRAATNAGLKTKFIKKDLKDISELQLPMILLMSNSSSCILDSFSDDRSKVKIISEVSNEIVEQWYDIEKIEKEYIGFGILLKKIFTYTNSDKEDKSNFTVKHWFWSTLEISKGIYIDVIFASILINLFILATPLFTMNVYDRVIPNNGIETLWFFSAGILLVYLLDIFLKLLRSYFLEIAAKKSDIIMSSIIFEKVLGLKLEFIPKPIGAFANNLKNFDVIRNFLTNSTLVAFIDVPFTILFLIVIYYLGGVIVIIPIVVILMILLMSVLLKNPIQNNIKKINEIISKKNSILIEVLNNLETLKSLGGNNNIRWNWEESNGNIAKIGFLSRMLSSFIPSFTSFLIQLNTVVIVIAGVYLIRDFELTMGSLIAIVILSSRAVAPMGQAAGLITNYEDAANSYKILNELMNKPEERPKNSDFVSRRELSGRIEFKNVTFKYPNTEVEILKNASFVINPGDRVAILGKIGTGKSTILKLILKLYEPTSGSILIDDIDITQLDPADIRRNMGYVSQHISLFNGTLKENIIFRASYVNDEKMLKAAKIANVDSFANTHPRGYDMPIGERGEGLSGGQIQSVGLARACLFDYPINLFDEPTSSMDKQTEDIVLDNLNNFMKNKTLIVITQKMPLLRIVDKIIVLNNSTVYLQGEKEAVIKALSQGDGFEK